MNQILEQMQATISAGHLSKYVSLIEKFQVDTRLRDDPDKYITTLDIAAAFFKMAVEQNSNPKTRNLNRAYLRNPDTKERKRSPFRPRNFQKSTTTDGEIMKRN